jgi:hypothetical protein
MRKLRTSLFAVIALLVLAVLSAITENERGTTFPVYDNGGKA